MSIINSIIQRKADLPSAQRELSHAMPTSGHLDSHGGLRGHSVDASTYPFRVVGHPGGVWSVQDAKGTKCCTFGTSRGFLSNLERDNYACEAAHKAAKLLKEQYPSGVMPLNEMLH